MKLPRVPLLLVLLLAFSSPTLWADDEPREREAERKRPVAGAHEPQREQTLKQLRERREHEQAERREREMRERGQRERSERERNRDGIEGAERRIIHLREAAENLAAVGKRDLAEELQREAGELERHLRERAMHEHREHGEHRPPSNEELVDMVNDLRNQVRELTEMVHQMRRELAGRRR